MGHHSPVAELLGVLQSLSSLPSRVPSTWLHVSWLGVCVGPAAGRTARAGAISGLSPPHTRSRGSLALPAPAHLLAPVLQPHVAVVSGRGAPP